MQNLETDSIDVNLQNTHVEAPTIDSNASNVQNTRDTKKSILDVSEAKFENAVWQSFGNMSALSRLLNVSYPALYAYLHHPNHKDMLDKVNLAKQQLVDDAESYIRTCLNDSNIDARTRVDLAKFILKTQGRQQGWSESPQIAQQINVQSENVDLKTIFGIPS